MSLRPRSWSWGTLRTKNSLGPSWTWLKSTLRISGLLLVITIKYFDSSWLVTESSNNYIIIVSIAYTLSHQIVCSFAKISNDWVNFQYTLKSLMLEWMKSLGFVKSLGLALEQSFVHTTGVVYVDEWFCLSVRLHWAWTTASSALRARRGTTKWRIWIPRRRSKWNVSAWQAAAFGKYYSTLLLPAIYCMVGAVWPDSHVSGGSCALCYSCHNYSVPSTCWELSGHCWWPTLCVFWVT